MPLFDYRCVDCENIFEALVDDREEEVECPECNEICTRVDRIYGDHQIQYGCDGFHRTDYEDKETQ